MPREHIDFHYVAPDHKAVHKRLENWALYVRLTRAGRPAPMWRFTRSNSRMWSPPDPLIPVDTRDGDRIEHIVATLPTYHREALRWCYVDRGAPAKMVRKLNVSYATLFQLVGDGRELVLHHLDQLNQKWPAI